MAAVIKEWFSESPITSLSFPTQPFIDRTKARASWLTATWKLSAIYLPVASPWGGAFLEKNLVITPASIPTLPPPSFGTENPYMRDSFSWALQSSCDQWKFWTSLVLQSAFWQPLFSPGLAETWRDAAWVPIALAWHPSNWCATSVSLRRERQLSAPLLHCTPSLRGSVGPRSKTPCWTACLRRHCAERTSKWHTVWAKVESSQAWPKES